MGHILYYQLNYVAIFKFEVTVWSDTIAHSVLTQTSNLNLT